MNNLFKLMLLVSLAFSSLAHSYDDFDRELTEGKIMAAQVMLLDRELDDLENDLDKKLSDLASITTDITEGKIIAAESNIIMGLIEELRSDLDLIDLHDDISFFEKKLEKIKNSIHNL